MTIEQLTEKFTTFPKYLNISSGKTAKKFNCNPQDVIAAKAIVRGKLKTTDTVDTNSEPAAKVDTSKNATSTFEQKKENAEYTFQTSKEIRSLEDLIKACDIDLTNWDIERYIINKWAVGSKNADKKIEVTPLFQVKVWLKPKVKEPLVDAIEQLIEKAKTYAPVYPSILYPEYLDGHLLVISPADIHINKLASAYETGDEYNIEIAINRVKEGVTGLLNIVRPFNIDKILFIAGNDILHTDNTTSTTTRGTFQDTQKIWFDAFNIAKDLMIDIIEMMLTVAPVHVDFNPSNHDYQSGFYLLQTISAWFSKCENIEFNVDISYSKYFVYHDNLIGSTHADCAKEKDLALLMAHESKDWSNCKHRYIYTHHIHHQSAKDYMSVNVNAVRSLSGTDSYHHKFGFQHAPKAIECFLHHKTKGRIGSFSHIF